SDTKDKDGDELKFRWEFGDGHKSYLEKTTHKYEDKGKFLVVLRVDDGSVYTFKKFEIEIEEYPEREVRIVKFIPNPVGKDSEEEIIWLKNETKKKVNLKGWSVATGGSMSKLVNHPIYDDFIIKPDSIKKLKREDCKFSLLNKKGRVVLRYPNGETADKVKYEKEKIEEGEVLEIKDRDFFWIKAESFG
ncbi:MAG: PKD domain-containing protein, partial [Patescibacteria group bacterium]|nr:PKD domain-containing protein [Patescibacteria group bacterium]